MTRVMMLVQGVLWTVVGIGSAVSQYPEGPTPEIIMLFANACFAFGLYFREDS